MRSSRVLIFGLNQYAFEIKANVEAQYEHVQIYALESAESFDESSDIELFDLSDDWESLDHSIDEHNSIAFCALEESAENIFLTISLRAHFKNLYIIAIASDEESANKLKMAGADKVIAIVETTADIIADVLEKPISNRVLSQIMYEESSLKIEQVKITNAAYFDNKPIVDIDWSRNHGIIILSVMHSDMSHEFIYAAKMKHRLLSEGDTLVVAGYQKDIDDFKILIGSE